VQAHPDYHYAVSSAEERSPSRHGALCYDAGMTVADIQSARARIGNLKRAYSPLLNASGIRLEQSLHCYMSTTARLRRSRVVKARSQASLAKLALSRARQPIWSRG
jgi:hypothetical protein